MKKKFVIHQIDFHVKILTKRLGLKSMTIFFNRIERNNFLQLSVIIPVEMITKTDSHLGSEGFQSHISDVPLGGRERFVISIDDHASLEKEKESFIAGLSNPRKHEEDLKWIAKQSPFHNP